jgi:hypothetical protein
VGAVESLNQTALGLLQSGAAYSFVASETDNHETPPPWDIRFPGVIDPEFGTEVTTRFTFSEESLCQAAAHYRAALRVNVFDTRAALGLLRTYYERMVARFAVTMAPSGRTSEVF